MTGPGIVEVSVSISAAPQTVFSYLTDPARYIQWMGSRATLEPTPGGAYQVQMSDGFAATGIFAEVEPPHRLVFTWGWADDDAAQHVLHGQSDPDGRALPPGSTRVEVILQAEDGGTHLKYPGPGGQLGRHIQHPLPIGQQPLRQRPADPVRALHRPDPLGPL